MTVGKDRVWAKTDGGLQIMIPKRDYNGNETEEQVIYNRAYYKLALEVLHPFSQLIQSKRFSQKNKEGVETEVDSTSNHPVHAGQIFAEMLATVAHPEYDCLDQEVFPPIHLM